MIRFIESILVEGSPTNENAKYVKSGFCLSTDTKPTGLAAAGLANGSCLVEIDTAVGCFYDEENDAWGELGNYTPSLAQSGVPVEAEEN